MKPEMNYRFECWNCHTSIAAKHAGSTCPHCGASLVREDFDVVASECAERYRRALVQSRVLEERLQELERKDKRFNPFGALLFLTALPWIKKLEKELLRCKRELHETKSELLKLSRGRWFTDPWYKIAGEMPGRGRKIRRARYNTLGYYIITPGQSRWRNPTRAQIACAPEGVSDANSIHSEDTQPFPCTQHHAA